ncbi:MAG: hypothetical protein WCC90_03220 [Methylocella sp.]
MNHWSDGKQRYLYEKHDGYSRHSGDEGTSVTHVMSGLVLAVRFTRERRTTNWENENA